MREIPLLYSKMMVLATIAGIKSESRMLSGLEKFNKQPSDWQFKEIVHHSDLGTHAFFLPAGATSGLACEICPYGRVGDLIWIKEEWQPQGIMDPDDGGFQIRFTADGKTISDYFEDSDIEEQYNEMIDAELSDRSIKIKADGSWYGKKCPLMVRPGIELWEEFSRVWLEITEVKVERLHDISEEDAIAEGIELAQVKSDIPLYKNYRKKGGRTQFPIFSFSTLWEKEHGVESVNANPWVWVIKFKVLSITGKSDIPAALEAATA